MELSAYEPLNQLFSPNRARQAIQTTYIYVDDLWPHVASLRPGLLKLDTIRPMTAEQAATLKRLAEAAYELDAFKPNLTRAEADVRIAMLTAKLKLLAEPPHTL